MGNISVNEIRNAADNWKNQLLVLVTTRLGMTNIETVYHTPILQMMQLDSFAGFVGGEPRLAYYFCG